MYHEKQTYTENALHSIINLRLLCSQAALQAVARTLEGLEVMCRDAGED